MVCLASGVFLVHCSRKFMFLKTKPNGVIVFEPTEPENDEPQFDKED